MLSFTSQKFQKYLKVWRVCIFCTYTYTLPMLSRNLQISTSSVTFLFFFSTNKSQILASFVAFASLCARCPLKITYFPFTTFSSRKNCIFLHLTDRNVCHCFSAVLALKIFPEKNRLLWSQIRTKQPTIIQCALIIANVLFSRWTYNSYITICWLVKLIFSTCRWNIIQTPIQYWT